MTGLGAGTVTIRGIDYQSESDRVALVALLESYADDPASAGAAGMSPDALGRLANDLSLHPTAFVLLAEVAGEAAGLAVCFEGYSTFAARPLLNLHDLVVLPERRGQGVGGALLDAVEREARRRGCGWITLEVLGTNPGAMNLYRRHGFAGGDRIDPPSAAMFWRKKLD